MAVAALEAADGGGPARLLVLLLLLLACDAGIGEDTDDVLLPRIRWGQAKGRLFVTIAMRQLDRATVKVNYEEDRLIFSASDVEGRRYAFNMELAQDILPSACRWEHLQRPDKFGDAVLATLQKKFPERWDALAASLAEYRQVLDKDWTREDQKLELPEEDKFFAEHDQYLKLVTASTLAKARQGVEVLVLLVRHASCEQCGVADNMFAKVAKRLGKKAKGANDWQARLRFGVVDARSALERPLVRRLGAGACAATPPDCRYYALAAGGEESLELRARHTEEPTIENIRNLARGQFLGLAAAQERRALEGNRRGLVVLPPDAPAPVLSVARSLRLRIDAESAAAGPEADALGFGHGGRGPLLVVWPPGEAWSESASEPLAYAGAPEGLATWLRPRVVAPLANTSAFEDDEPYEQLGLPLARLFVEEGALGEAAARAVVREVALRFYGRVAFVARSATAKSYEWRQHGLPPGSFPSFGLAASPAHNSTKWAFLAAPRSEAARAAFWEREARDALPTFIEDALAGRLQPNLMSEEPSDKEQAEAEVPGAARRLVGRTCRAVLEDSAGEILLEGYDEWRRDNVVRKQQMDILAPLLWTWNITVYRLDFGYNECPPSLVQTISAGYSGYFFAPPRMRARGLKMQKLKKLDPPFDRVLQFLARHSESGLDANATLAQLESTMLSRQRWAAAAAAGDRRTWGVAAVTVAVAAAGALFLRRRQRPRGPVAPPGWAASGVAPGSKSE